MYTSGGGSLYSVKVVGSSETIRGRVQSGGRVSIGDEVEISDVYSQWIELEVCKLP